MTAKLNANRFQNRSVRRCKDDHFQNSEPEEKVAFLSRPLSYPHGPMAVEVKETHMSWVFLAGTLAYKLKMPVSDPFLDFTTLEARRVNFLEEVRLNSRLAAGVYLGTLPLCATAAGELFLQAAGETVDWLVCMNRLPADLMLDERIANGCLSRGEVEHAAERLMQFYLKLPPLNVSAE